MATSPYEYIDSTGVIVPDTANLKSEVEAEYVEAFGTDLVISDDTPQGVLIVAETIARDEVVRNNAALANQINPNEAGGVFLDAILALTGTVRNSQTYSYTTCFLTGVPGTVIPATTSTAKNENNDVFASISTVTLNGDGEATVTFQALEPGPIGAQAGTLTQIVNGVLGWETITNTDDAVLGSLTQSDESAREFRRNTLALQGMALPEAITSALYATTGVKSLTFRENVTSSIQVIDGVTMKPHSMYVCVDGGTDEDVATVLLEKKSGGCDYTNDAGIPITVDVVEPASGQVYPVSFDRPNIIVIEAQVTISVNNSITGDPVKLVKDAIIAYANGLIEGESGFSVGTPVSSFELAGAINITYPGIFVKNLGTKLAGSPGDYSSNELPITIYQKATITENDIVVIIT